MARFITPPDKRKIGWPSRWTLKPAGRREAPHVVDRDVRGKFRPIDKPDPKWVRDVIQKGEKKGWW